MIKVRKMFTQFADDAYMRISHHGDALLNKKKYQMLFLSSNLLK